MVEAEAWAEHAYLRSQTSCAHAFCRSFSVEEALFMCMFHIWQAEYGPGWEYAINAEDPVLDELIHSGGGAT